MADKPTFIEVTGLWEKAKQDGTVYLTGNLNQNCRVLIFKNDRKTADNQPDYRLYIAPNDRQQQGGGSSGGQRASQRSGGGSSGGGGRFNQRGGGGEPSAGGDDGGPDYG